MSLRSDTKLRISFVTSSFRFASLSSATETVRLRSLSRHISKRRHDSFARLRELVVSFQYESLEITKTRTFRYNYRDFWHPCVAIVAFKIDLLEKKRNRPKHIEPRNCYKYRTCFFSLFLTFPDDLSLELNSTRILF